MQVWPSDFLWLVSHLNRSQASQKPDSKRHFEEPRVTLPTTAWKCKRLLGRLISELPHITSLPIHFPVPHSTAVPYSILWGPGTMLAWWLSLWKAQVTASAWHLPCRWTQLQKLVGGGICRESRAVPRRTVGWGCPGTPALESHRPRKDFNPWDMQNELCPAEPGVGHTMLWKEEPLPHSGTWCFGLAKDPFFFPSVSLLVWTYLPYAGLTVVFWKHRTCSISLFTAGEHSAPGAKPTSSLTYACFRWYSDDTLRWAFWVDVGTS